MKKVYVDIGYSEPTVIYEIKLKKIAEIKNVTVEQIANKLDELETTNVVIEASSPHVIDKLRTKFLVQRLRKWKREKNADN